MYTQGSRYIYILYIYIWPKDKIKLSLNIVKYSHIQVSIDMVQCNGIPVHGTIIHINHKFNILNMSLDIIILKYNVEYETKQLYVTNSWI
jgi:hypothetical protein